MHQAVPEAEVVDEGSCGAAARDDRLGPDVHGDPADLVTADLASGSVAAVEDGDLEVGPPGEQVVGGGQTGDTATDDDHRRGHGPSFPPTVTTS